VKDLLRRLVRGTPLYHPLRNVAVKRAQLRQLAEWERNERPVPPPHAVKQQALLAHADRYGLRTLVETGTCYGDMVEAVRRDFERVYSIELSEDLHAEARRRFRGRSNVVLVQGDSAVELADVIRSLEGPALFWLDGHYSGADTAKGEQETPVLAELRHIFAEGNATHVVIVDDARLFGTDPAYPSVDELCAFVGSLQAGVDILVKDDMIHIVPNSRR